MVGGGAAHDSTAGDDYVISLIGFHSVEILL
jgi:hypothetical protein